LDKSDWGKAPFFGEGTDIAFLPSPPLFFEGLLAILCGEPARRKWAKAGISQLTIN